MAVEFDDEILPMGSESRNVAEHPFLLIFLGSRPKIVYPADPQPIRLHSQLSQLLPSRQIFGDSNILEPQRFQFGDTGLLIGPDLRTEAIDGLVGFRQIID